MPLFQRKGIIMVNVNRSEDCGQTTDELKEQVKETIGNIASAVGDRVEKAASSVAGALETGGRYLQEHDLSDVSNDLVNLIRHNPIPAVLISMGIGYLLARALRR
jgi:hypothetical protein